MIIQPQSTIQLYSGIPFTTARDHTILFNSVAEQLTYFAGKLAGVNTNATYVRHDRIRLAANAENIYPCNYCSFTNTGFGSKRFYAFITDVTFVNEKTTEVTIEIDPWQTWMFELSIGKCFVEREHVSDDSPGAHTVPEGLETGPYTIGTLDLWRADDVGVALYVVQPEFEPYYVNNIYTGLSTYGYKRSELADLNTALANFNDTPEKVAMIKMVTSEMVDSGSRKLKTFTDSVEITMPTSIDGYTPANNKLFSYPYCYLEAFNFAGITTEYRYELFKGAKTFFIEGYPLPQPSITATPNLYQGAQSNYPQSLAYTSFPTCPYVVDTFKTWMAYDAKQLAINTASSFVGSAMTSTYNPGAIASGVGSVANSMVEVQKHKAHNGGLQGSIGEACAAFARGSIGFYFTGYTITKEYAEIIDDFFTRYGYKVNRFKIPNTNNRNSFNYVKTSNAIVNGNIPDDARTALCASLDNGFTFWHTTNVLEYNVENDIKVVSE